MKSFDPADKNKEAVKTAVFAYSRKGILLSCSLAECFSPEDVTLYTIPRLCGGEGFLPITDPSAKIYEDAFSRFDLLIFVGALGIAVRMIAPFVKDKRTDPAVLCLDEKGTYVIPVLSGHIGGANRLAEEIAEKTGAKAIVTTATDINRRFSVDSWALEKGLLIEDMNLAKKVSAEILEKDIPIFCEPPLKTRLFPDVPETFEGLYLADKPSDFTEPLGIYIGWKTESPFPETLRLIPKILHLGIGCRKNTKEQEIREAVQKALSENHIHQKAIRGVFSIDLKASEEGLLSFCKNEALPAAFYSAEELSRVPGEFSSSAFVERITGVDNVCERAALIKAEELIVRKTSFGKVTIALAREAGI